MALSTAITLVGRGAPAPSKRELGLACLIDLEAVPDADRQCHVVACTLVPISN